MAVVVVRGTGWTVEMVEDVREEARRHGYDLTADELDGICLPREHLVMVDASLQRAHRMEIVLHELLHAYDPDLPERRVRVLARTLARALWRLGYRDRATAWRRKAIVNKTQ